MKALLYREVTHTDLFVFLLQHESSLGELLNSIYGSIMKKNGWNEVALGKKNLISVVYMECAL